MTARAETLARVLAEAGEIPTLPTVVTQGLRLLADERAGLRDVADSISSDPVLGARVLRLVNSAVFGLKARVTTIQDGVLFLGTKQVRNLLLSSAVVDAISNKDVEFRPHWEHAFGTAYVASSLSRLLRAGWSDDVYLGGLFHDMGRILLVARHPERYHAALERSRERKLPLPHAEQEVFGATHAEIGAWVAERWGFPERVTMVVRHHHTPRLARGFEADAATVRLADYLCWSRGLIDVAEDLVPTDIAEDDCWDLLREHAVRKEGLDVHALLHEADRMVHTARLLVEAVYAS